MTMANREAILEVRNLSKVYKVYPKPSDLARELVTGRCCHQESWALQDVSFDLHRGEILGVIGSNGAGKSTLLRIIAGVLDQTSGQVSVKGQVSAILGLGTSFNPEHSGRENVRLALMYAGMSSREVEDKINEVVAFSELDSVIDNPVKTYSSGMHARLTFSTAIAVRNEVLLIDEALAAGDAYFTAKCLRYLHEICQDSNTSALLVSHSMRTLVHLCDRALYLRKGRLVMQGLIRDVVNSYEKAVLGFDEELLHAQQSLVKDTPLSPKGPFSILRTYTKSNGEVSPVLFVGERAEVVIEYESQTAFDDVWVGLELYSHLEGNFVSTLHNKACRVGDLRKPCEMTVHIVKGRGILTFKCDPLLYGPGLYFYHFSLFTRECVDGKRMEYADAILHQRYVGQFRVKHRDSLYFEKIQIVEPPLEVTSGEL